MSFFQQPALNREFFNTLLGLRARAMPPDIHPAAGAGAFQPTAKPSCRTLCAATNSPEPGLARQVPFSAIFRPRR